MLSRYESTVDQSVFKHLIEGKRVLIIGSGPSVKERGFDPNYYDTILTTSFFYLKSDLPFDKIKFVGLSRLVDLESALLNNFLNNYDCLVGFEKYDTPFYSSQSYKSFVNRYKDRVIDYWTSNHHDSPLIGVGGRMIYFAMNFNPSELHFIGIDGTSKTPASDPENVFRPEIRGSIHTDKNSPRHDVKRMQESHNKMIEILHKEGTERNVKLQNLGEGLPYNMSTNLTKKYFPLK